MRVAIFGTGYVGLVTETCLAEVGHEVVCVDIDQAKVDGLDNGVIPIYEPGLEPMVKANHAAGRLRFTTDAGQAVAHGEVIFIAVGTPPDEDGSADLQYVLRWPGRLARICRSPRWWSTSRPCRWARPAGCAKRSRRRSPGVAHRSDSTSCPTRNSRRRAPRSRTACDRTAS